MATNIFEVESKSGVNAEIVVSKIAEAISTYAPRTITVEDANNDDGMLGFVRRADGVYVDNKTGRITLPAYLDYLCLTHEVDRVRPHYLNTFAVWQEDDTSITLEFVWRTHR